MDTFQCCWCMCSARTMLMAESCWSSAETETASWWAGMVQQWTPVIWWRSSKIPDHMRLVTSNRPSGKTGPTGNSDTSRSQTAGPCMVFRRDLQLKAEAVWNKHYYTDKADHDCVIQLRCQADQHMAEGEVWSWGLGCDTESGVMGGRGNDDWHLKWCLGSCVLINVGMIWRRLVTSPSICNFLKWLETHCFLEAFIKNKNI